MEWLQWSYSKPVGMVAIKKPVEIDLINRSQLPTSPPWKDDSSSVLERFGKDTWWTSGRDQSPGQGVKVLSDFHRTWWPKPQRDVWIRSLAETRCTCWTTFQWDLMALATVLWLITSTAHHFWLEFWRFTNFSKQSCMYRDRWSRHLDRKDMIESDLWYEWNSRVCGVLSFQDFRLSKIRCFSQGALESCSHFRKQNSDNININHHSDFVAFNTLPACCCISFSITCFGFRKCNVFSTSWRDATNPMFGWLKVEI